MIGSIKIIFLKITIIVYQYDENELKNILESDGTYDNIIKNSKEILKNNINVDWNNIIF